LLLTRASTDPRRPPLPPSCGACSSAPHQRRLSLPSPLCAPSAATQVVSCPAVPPPSPECMLQRPPPSGAAEPPRRLLPQPVRARESSPGHLQAVLHPRPAGTGHRFARIWPDRRRPVPRDPIARGDFFSRAELQREGML
jgi:hypothetical protein